MDYWITCIEETSVASKLSTEEILILAESASAGHEMYAEATGELAQTLGTSNQYLELEKLRKEVLSLKSVLEDLEKDRDVYKSAFAIRKGCHPNDLRHEGAGIISFPL